MLKRKLSVLAGGLMLTMGLLAGCGDAENTEEEAADNQLEAQITITESAGEEIIAEEEVPFEEGDVLLDVMEENFDLEEEGGFITEIEGVSQNPDEKEYWLYTVNGEMAEVGAADLELSDGDEVEFDLQKTE